MKRNERSRLVLLLLPALIVSAVFFLAPMIRLLAISLEGGVADTYVAFLTTPRYLTSIAATTLLSVTVTLAALLISGIAGVFLQRNEFPFKRSLVAMLTFPLAFPGVVVGFLVIILGGRQGVVGYATEALIGHKLVFAYSMTGLFIGYLYFSIPRVILTIMAAAEKLDPALEEAARTLGASPLRVVRDVILPGLSPALMASGAICFATSMGAFGTAFTLGTNIDVLPLTIYTEFTLNANIGMAAAMSIVLGALAWAILYLARNVRGATAVPAA